MTYENIVRLIGKDKEYLLSSPCKTVPKEKLYLPGADFIERVCTDSNRNIQTLCSLNTLFNSGK